MELRKISSKKAFAPTLILPIVLGILIIIAGILIFSSLKFRLTAIGVGLLALTFIYGVKPAFEGDLTVEKRNVLLVLLVSGLLLIIIPSSGVMQEAFGDFPSSNLNMMDYNKVYIPFYTSLSCVQTQEFATAFTVDGEGMYYCGGNLGSKTGDLNYYVPSGCNYRINDGYGSYVICEQSDEKCDLSFWDLLSSKKSFNKGQILPVVKYGQKILIDETVPFGKASVTVSATRYQLRVKRSDGKETLYPTCNINNLDYDYISGETDVSKLTNNQIQPQDSITNLITHFAEIVGSKNVINNGRTYIKDTGVTCDIVKSVDGYKFVDLDSCIVNANIKCNPAESARCECSTTSCSFKETEEGNSCSAFYRPEDYLTETQFCKTSCVNSKIVKKCENKITCPADKPILTIKNTEMICVASESAYIPVTGTCEKWYQEPGIQTTYKYQILGFKFGAVEKPVCKVASWLAILEWGLMIILALVVFYFLTKPKAKKK